MFIPGGDRHEYLFSWQITWLVHGNGNMQLFVRVEEYQSFSQGLFFVVVQSEPGDACGENVFMQGDIVYAFF